MKLLVFVFFLILMPVMILAQSAKLKWLFNINYGVSNYIGNGANHNTYMNGTIPVENDYTQNPFGKKMKAALGIGINIRKASSEGKGFMYSFEFLRLGSRVNLDGVTYPIRPSILRPATGSTSITANEISVGLSRYLKTGYHLRSPYIFYGVAGSFQTMVDETGLAIDYTRTGAFKSDLRHQKQNYVQAQVGTWIDFRWFCMSLQYRLALNSIRNPVVDGERMRPQSLFYKIAIALQQ
ncbi:MAG: hypothetical protein WCJ85_01070 [Chitinophagaceae bacterium]